MQIDTKLFHCGWFDIEPEVAIFEHNLPQAARLPWQLFMIGFLGVGVALMARPKP